MALSTIVLAAVLPFFDFATNSIAQRIAGVDPAVCLSRFVECQPSKGWRSNEKFWLKDVDFSCASPWNDECGAQRAGTLISKRHIIFARHFPLWKGVRIHFVGQDGEVCPCRIAKTLPLMNSDIMIGLLDYEVTPNIHPAKILPDDYAKYIGTGNGLPIVTFNREEKAYLSELNSIWTTPKLKILTNLASKNSAWKMLKGNLVGGDSGNPAFLLIGNEPILLYCVHQGGAGHGPSILHNREEIQKAMDELCPGYRLETFDLEKVRCDDGK